MSDTFYPSCVVHLNLTFEKKLYVREEAGQNQFRTSPLATNNNNGTFVMNRVPKKMTCRYQGHTAAATWTLVFDYKELPIDPRTIAASTAEIYLGTVSAEHFADGMKHEWRPGVRRSILQTRDANHKTIQKDMLIVGPVDSWKISYEKDGAEVHLEGRDLRGLLLDSPLVSARDHFDYNARFPTRVPRRKRTNILNRLNTKQNIVDLVQQILLEHDRLRELVPDIEVIAYKEEWPNGVILSPGAGSHLPRHRRGASGQNSNPGSAHSGLNFWDIITRYCQPKDALVCKDDFTWVPIGQIQKGDKLLGFGKDTNPDLKRKFNKFRSAEVEEVFVRRAPVVALHMESGRVVRCTPDHHWYTGRSEKDYEFAMPCEGRPLVRVFDAPNQPFSPDEDYRLGYVRGLIDGDGCFQDKTYVRDGKKSRTKHVTLAMNDTGALSRYSEYCRQLGLTPREGQHTSGEGYSMPCVRMCTQEAIDRLIHAEEPTTDSYMKGWLAGMFDAEGCTSNGLEICQVRSVNPVNYAKIGARLRHFGFEVSMADDRYKVLGGSKEALKFFWLVQPAAVFKFQKYLLDSRMFGTKDRVLRIEELGEEEVVSLKTSTGTYIGQGYASRNCYLCAAVPRFVGRRLEIRYAPTLYSMVRGFNSRIPFANGEARVDEDGNEWVVRRLVYGRDVDNMSIDRKFAGNNKPKTVRCICVDRSSRDRGRGQLLEAVWPPRNRREANREGLHGTRAQLQDYIGGEESSEILNIPVRGIRNMAQLTSIAQSFYEQIGRQEMKAEVHCDKVTSFGGDNADPDILRMRVGDPVELLVDARRMSSGSAVASTIANMQNATFAECVAEVRKLLPDENLARAIVASARGNIMGVLRYFRVGSIDFDWSNEDGISVKTDLQNYWTPTFDPNAHFAAEQHRAHNHADRAHAQHAQASAAQSTSTQSSANATSLTPPAVAHPSEELRQRARRVGELIQRERGTQGTVDSAFDSIGAASRWRDI